MVKSRVTNGVAATASGARLSAAAWIGLTLPVVVLVGSLIAFPLQRNAQSATAANSLPQTALAESMAASSDAIDAAQFRPAMDPALKIVNDLDHRAQAENGRTEITSAELHVLRQHLQSAHGPRRTKPKYGVIAPPFSAEKQPMMAPRALTPMTQ